jgi:hypothetical protein
VLLRELVLDAADQICPPSLANRFFMCGTEGSRWGSLFEDAANCSTKCWRIFTCKSRFPNGFKLAIGLRHHSEATQHFMRKITLAHSAKLL